MRVRLPHGAAFATLLGLVSIATGCGVPDEPANLPPAIACNPNVPLFIDATATVSFDERHMLCIRVKMKPDKFDELRVQNRFGAENDRIAQDLIERIVSSCTEPFPNAFTWFQADIEVDGVPMSRVGIRKKGFVGSVIGDGFFKPSLKIKTDKHTKGQKLGDTERITVNNQTGDRTRINTCMAYHVFRRAGYPAPLCNMASVMMDGKPLGAFAHVEAVKKPMMKRLFGTNKGSLYEGTLADFSEEATFGFPDGQLGHWDPKSDDTDANGRPLMGIVEALRQPDDKLIAALDKVMDVPLFVRFWALEALIGHGDGYASNRNNFYVYFNPNDGGRAVFIPWGADTVFGEDTGEEAPGGGFGGYNSAELPRRLSRIETTRAMFEKEMRQLLKSAWNEAALKSAIDIFAKQVGTAQDDDGYQEAIGTMKDWIDARRAIVLKQLENGVARGSAHPGGCSGAPGFDFRTTGLDFWSWLTFAW